MKRTVYLKLLASYLVFGILVILIMTCFSQTWVNQAQVRNEEASLYREAQEISSNYASAYLNNNVSGSVVQDQLEIMSSYNDSVILLTDTQGNLLMDSRDKSIYEAASDQYYYSISGFDITDFGNKYYKTGQFYDQADNCLAVFATVTISYSVRGYVLILKNLDTIYGETVDYMNQLYLTLALVYLASFVILVCFSFVVYRPVRKITKAANDFAQGDFTKTIDVHSNDEIGYLGKTLNYMAQELDSQEEDQRKFVSNVSHDFRSPLTSIKGYCEAMLDGTIPVEMQDKYLNIILSETDRLNKLTKSLLDLNRFGQHGIRLDLCDFELNSMIKTTLLTFEGVCKEKNIMIDLVLTGEELFVQGDMVKIQQVLYNLIDNAIKFSHHNSSIKIETNVKNEKVLVSVKDHGIGIPADSVKKIWERFYKTDASRGRDKRGTGLGLSIVKEIITAHKQNIDVISTEGVGTEFTFSLQLAERSLD